MLVGVYQAAGRYNNGRQAEAERYNQIMIRAYWGIYDKTQRESVFSSDAPPGVLPAAYLSP